MISKRSFLWVVLPLALVVVNGCSDATGPRAGRGASVQIYLAGSKADEQTIALGATLYFDARILDVAGKALEGETADWSSTQPGVASVDDSGFVTGRTVGTTFIIATHPAGVDSVRINVAEAVEGGPDCTGIASFPIEPGEVRVVPGDEADLLCLSGGTFGAEYTLVAVNTGTSAGSTLPVLVDAADLVSGEEALARAPATREPTTSLEAFHRHLRVDVSRELEARLRAGVDASQFAPRMQVTVGNTLTFNVETSSSDNCGTPILRGGRVEYVGAHSIVVADTLNPADGFTAEDYQSLASYFDDDVWPLVTTNFGRPSDIDSNGKVIIFFTRAVNDLASNGPNSSTVVKGFFANRDLFPKSSCAGSNEAEMFYALVPNPAPAAGERRFTTDFARRSARNVLVHEFQHLVNDSRRLYVNKAPVWEETWLNEGLSHIAEELMFYQEAGLTPGENLGSDDFLAPGPREAFRGFQIENLLRYAVYLRAPEVRSLMGQDGLATRGAAWSFLRYAADRRGGDETQLWNALVRDARSAGLENLGTALAADPGDWIRDWSAALYLDDTDPGVDPRYTIRSWNFRDLFPASGALWPDESSIEDYPLAVRIIDPADPMVLPIQGGGAAYLRADVAAGQVGAVRLLIDSSPLVPAPERLQVVITRRG